MATYFSNFPVINYNLDRDGVTLIPTVDLTRRFKPLQSILEKATLYYPYQIKEGERPDIVSDLIYGRVDFDWIILMFNNMLDPYFAWPFAYDQFVAYLTKKYGSVQTAQTTVAQYLRVIQPATKYFDGTNLPGGTNIPAQTLVIDQTAYNALPASSRQIVYAYDMELQANDARRNIQILDAIYIPEILNEKANIFT